MNKTLQHLRDLWPTLSAILASALLMLGLFLWINYTFF